MTMRFPQRNKEIADTYVNSTITLQELADIYNVSRERIRQILRMFYPDYKREKKYRPTKEERLEQRIEKRISEFWNQTKLDTSTGCLEWQGYKYEITGYGRYSCNLVSSTQYTHRLAWIFTNGDIPEDMNVLHRCDNPICVNPKHLYLGTKADNIRDREERFKNIPWKERDRYGSPRRVVSN